MTISEICRIRPRWLQPGGEKRVELVGWRWKFQMEEEREGRGELEEREELEELEDWGRGSSTPPGCTAQRRQAGGSWLEIFSLNTTLTNTYQLSGTTNELLENINNQFLADGGWFVGTDCLVSHPPTLSHKSPALTRVGLGLGPELRLGARARVSPGREEREELVQLPPEQSASPACSSPAPGSSSPSAAAEIFPLVNTLLSPVICTANKVFQARHNSIWNFLCRT